MTVSPDRHFYSVKEAAELLGVDFDEHVEFVIGAMTDNAEALGLAGIPVSADAD